MIRKILIRSQSYWQLLLALLGSFAGMFILLAAVQFYVDLSSVLNKRDDLLGSDYVVVQKKISTLSTLSISGIHFSEEEIKEMEAQKFVDRVGVFQSSAFKVFASISGFEQAPDLLTEAFFEAIPDEFIDVKSEEWKWNQNAETVPVILPSAYLDAFNFGFGPAQGLPLLSEKAFKMLQLKIVIRTKGENYLFSGKIIGFSDRLNTILVPLSFLEFANAQFATKAKTPPARIILAVKDSSDPALAKFINDKNYDTNDNDLKQSRVKTILLIILSVLLVLGGIIILLSLLSIMQYAQVIISRVQYELKVLLLMGYSHWHLWRKYVRYFGTYFVIIMVASISLLYFIKQWFTSFLSEYNFKVAPDLAFELWCSSCILLIVFILVNAFGIFLQLRRLAKNLQ